MEFYRVNSLGLPSMKAPVGEGSLGDPSSEEIADLLADLDDILAAELRDCASAHDQDLLFSLIERSAAP